MVDLKVKICAEEPRGKDDEEEEKDCRRRTPREGETLQEEGYDVAERKPTLG